MKKILILGFWLLGLSLIFTRPVFGLQTCDPGTSCTNCSFTPSPDSLVEGTFDTIRFFFYVDDPNPDRMYTISSDGCVPPSDPSATRYRKEHITPQRGLLGPGLENKGLIDITITEAEAPRLFKHCFGICPCRGDNHFLSIIREGVTSEPHYCPDFEFRVVTPTPTLPECELRISPATGITKNTKVSVSGSGLKNETYYLYVFKNPIGLIDRQIWGPQEVFVKNGSFTAINLGSFGDGDYSVVLKDWKVMRIPCRGGTFSVLPGEGGTAPTPVPKCPQRCVSLFINNPYPDEVCFQDEECRKNCRECQFSCPASCRDDFIKGLKDVACSRNDCKQNCLTCGAKVPTPPVIAPELIKLEQLCGKVACPYEGYRMNGEQKLCCTGGQGEICNKEITDEGKNCLDCLSRKGGGSWTAIGCIPTDFPLFLKKYVFGPGIGLAGGICFLLLLYGGFTIMTSAGVPEKLNEGKEVIVSALMGLILIIFSVLILKIVGVDILQLPGFG